MVRKIPRERKRLTFFKLILPCYSSEHLRIPPKFRKHIMNELSERATLSLKTSLECSWNVKVRKSGRQVYFEDGWQKFLRDNSLGDCEFLLFNYDGKMHFAIQIFDKSGCERDDFPDTEQQNFNLAESTKRTGGRPTKYTVTGSKPFNSCKENSSNVIKVAGKQIACCESEYLKEVKEDDADADADAESAEPFPHFTSKLRSTAFQVYVPTPFYKKHLALENYEVVLLKISNGNRWYEVKLASYRDTVYMTEGLYDFAVDNQVKLGSVCKFEFLKERKMVVHILKE